MEFTTYDGQKVDISYEEYAKFVRWRDETLRRVGKDLAAIMPNIYGRIEFNLQGGKFVNANIIEGVK